MEFSSAHQTEVEKLLRGHPHLTGLHHHPQLTDIKPHLKSPFETWNPTHAHYTLAKPGRDGKGGLVAYHWSSRNNRKGRHGLVFDQDALDPASPYNVPPVTSSLKETSRGVWRMITDWPIWDISFDVAQAFTWGSVIWVVNAFFVWLPLVRPETEFENEELIGGGITAFIGASTFLCGSVLLMIEAVNENRTGCFGWAIKQTEHAWSNDDEEKVGDKTRFSPHPSLCTHHHRNKRHLDGKGIPAVRETAEDPSSSKPQTWEWWPSMALLRSHYIREIGFIASATQMLAATIFEVAGLTALPGIHNKMSRPVLNVFYWTPQVVGGTGFIVSGALFMVETQSRWWKPAPRTLGWWVGFWNMIGGFGFTICPAFGYCESSWCQYQSSLSTFWGSWAFLLGSVIQWYESLSKYPVRVLKNGKIRSERDWNYR